MLIVLFTFTYFTAVVYGGNDVDCNDGGFYIRADPKSTTHFYKCDNGQPVRFKCADGLIYNKELHVCDWPQNVDKSATGTSGKKPSTNGGQQYSGNNGKPTSITSDKNGNKNKKPSNNEGYTGNNGKPSNSAQQHNSKPSKTGQTEGSTSSGAGFETPWHYQSYSTDEADIYPVQIIDNNVDLDGLGYKNG